MMDMFGNSNLWDEPDMVLSYIVTMLVSTMGVEVDVTLMTRGAVISGTLISEAVYLQKLTDTLMEKVKFTNQDVPEEAREALKSVLDLRDMSEFNPSDYLPEEDVADAADTIEDDIGEQPPVLMHLHLRDPLVVSGEVPIDFGEGGAALLRLRLTSIDGWMLGRVQPGYDDFSGFDDGEIRH